MKFTNWIIYTLILSFLVVLSPRELWHNCKDHNEVHTKNEVHFEQKTCFACDFDLGIIDQFHLTTFSFAKRVYSNYFKSAIDTFLQTDFDPFSHRGPPQFLF